MLEADLVTIIDVVPKTGALEVRAMSPRMHEPTVFPSGSRSFAGYVVLSRKVVVVDNADHDRRFEVTTTRADFHTASAIGAPIFGPGGYAASSQPRAPPPRGSITREYTLSRGSPISLESSWPISSAGFDRPAGVRHSICTNYPRIGCERESSGRFSGWAPLRCRDRVRTDLRRRDSFGSERVVDHSDRTIPWLTRTAAGAVRDVSDLGMTRRSGCWRRGTGGCANLTS